MKAIIFAAGVGQRLQAVTRGKPKCLVEIGGRTLLSRHVDCLNQLGVHQIVLVVGFAQDLIRDAMVTEFPSCDVRWVVNDQFTRGSILSLWVARDEMDDDVVLMDADVFYAPEILARLVRSPEPSVVLMDETVQQESEECMVAARGGRVLSLSKVLPAEYEEAGEGVGFLKVQKRDVPALLRSVQSHVDIDKMDIEYEDALETFFQNVSVGYEKIGGIPWIEIDFPEDVDRATSQILPAIQARESRISTIPVSS
jgi:choline kinase